VLRLLDEKKWECRKRRTLSLSGLSELPSERGDWEAPWLRDGGRFTITSKVLKVRKDSEGRSKRQKRHDSMKTRLEGHGGASLACTRLAQPHESTCLAVTSSFCDCGLARVQCQWETYTFRRIDIESIKRYRVQGRKRRRECRAPGLKCWRPAAEYFSTVIVDKQAI
jgi:hypothetical protein